MTERQAPPVRRRGNHLEHALLASFKRYFPKLGSLRPYVARPAKRLGQAVFGDTRKDRIRSGNWYGNDTTWRMVLDLNRALRYGNGVGVLHDQAQRKYFCVVDGIIAGEGNGPMGSDPRPEGLIIAGRDPLAVDLTCARIMGFDYRKVPMLFNALNDHPYPLNSVRYVDIECRSNVSDYDRMLLDFDGPCLSFRPHFGWLGHLAITDLARDPSRGVTSVSV